MAYVYDVQNIFAQIIRGEIPNKTVLETEYTLAFHDIQPQAPTHILVIPTGPYVTADHFAAAASTVEIVDFYRSLGAVAEQAGLSQSKGGNGYRIISNAGNDGHQEVSHYHVHVVGGRKLGWMLQRVSDAQG